MGNLFNPLVSKKVVNEKGRDRCKSKQQENQQQKSGLQRHVESLFKKRGSCKARKSRKGSFKSLHRQCSEEEEDHNSKIKLQRSDSISSLERDLIEMRKIIRKSSKTMKTADLEDSFRTIDSLMSSIKTKQQKHQDDDEYDTNTTESTISSPLSVYNNNDPRKKCNERTNRT